MKRKNKTIVFIIIMLVLIIIILYLLILDFGKIKNHDSLIPTGNVDIFDIDCNCKDDVVSKPNDEDILVFNEKIEQGTQKEQNGNNDVNENKLNEEGLIVSDNYSLWGEKELRIFSNPSYEYTSKIAPKSSNSYTFVVHNNNNFDIVVDFNMIETNDYGVNMKYKLRSKGNFIVGDANTYEDISKLQLKGITMKAKESVSYILDWKWIDSENDTEIGEKIDVYYKLAIHIGANQK